MNQRAAAGIDDPGICPGGGQIQVAGDRHRPHRELRSRSRQTGGVEVGQASAISVNHAGNEGLGLAITNTDEVVVRAISLVSDVNVETAVVKVVPGPETQGDVAATIGEGGKGRTTISHIATTGGVEG